MALSCEKHDHYLRHLEDDKESMVYKKPKQKLSINTMNQQSMHQHNTVSIALN